MKSKPKDTKSLTIEEQLKLADSIIGMLISRVHRDETTDPTGFTITKHKLGEHAGKVIEDIEHGALQPTKFRGKFL